MKPIE